MKDSSSKKNDHPADAGISDLNRVPPSDAMPTTAEDAQTLIASLRTQNAKLALECADMKSNERRFRFMIEHAREVIAVIGEGGELRYCNAAWERVLDYRVSELEGRNVRDLLHPTDLPRVFRSFGMFVRTPGAVIHREFRLRRKDGTWQHLEATLTNLLYDPDMYGIVLNGHDITERVRSEAFYKASLKEKETLVKEIHHRVKNNLQLISSMLGLQAHHIADEEIARVFHDSKNRIKSMALIHEKLYQHKSLAEVDVSEYLSTLVRYLIGSHGLEHQPIRIAQSAGGLKLDADTMIHLGLLVNEVVTNSVKHGFPDGRGGEIRIEASEGAAPGTVVVRIADTGIGLPASVDIHHAQTLGLQLIMMLGVQLDAAIDVDTGSTGTTYTITIPTAKRS